MITLLLEHLAAAAPHVSLIHDYPGTVRTALWNDVPGHRLTSFLLIAYSLLGEALGWPGHVRLYELAERHVFLAASTAFPPKKAAVGKSAGSDIDRVIITRGCDGREGSGVYSLGWDCEPSPAEIEAMLARLRETGVGELVWRHNIEEFERIVDG